MSFRPNISISCTYGQYRHEKRVLVSTDQLVAEIEYMFKNLVLFEPNPCVKVETEGERGECFYVDAQVGEGKCYSLKVNYHTELPKEALAILFNYNPSTFSIRDNGFHTYPRPKVELTPLTTLSKPLLEINIGKVGFRDQATIFTTLGTSVTKKLTLECSLSDTDAQTLALSLQDNKTIEEFYFTNFADLTSRGAESFFTMLKVNTTLKRLDLGFKALDNKAIKVLGHSLEVNGSLRDIDLSYVGDTTSSEGWHCFIKSLGSNLTLKGIETTSQLSEEVIKEYSESLQPNVTLTGFYFNNIPIRDGELKEDELQVFSNVPKERIDLWVTEKKPVKKLVITGGDKLCL